MILSKALAKSSRMASICDLLSIAVIQSWTVMMSWDSQDSPLQRMHVNEMGL